MDGYDCSYFNGVLPVSAQLNPKGLRQCNTTINSLSDITTMHTYCIIVGSNALLDPKLPVIKKAAIS